MDDAEEFLKSRKFVGTETIIAKDGSDWDVVAVMRDFANAALAASRSEEATPQLNKLLQMLQAGSIVGNSTLAENHARAGWD